MGASKTANALMARFNYIERGQKVALIKPRTDTREKEDVVRSRIGIEAPCIYFDEITTDIYSCDCVIVDEAQFLSDTEIMFLCDLVDFYDIPVLCYGLRADFQGRLFPGSEKLLSIADEIREIKTVCWCGRKAIMNARIKDGKMVQDGPQVQIGGNESYIALCRKHWRAQDLGFRDE